MIPDDDQSGEHDGADAAINAGYANLQIAKALSTAAGHADPATRERALRRAQRWRTLLDKIARRQLHIGSRTPVPDAPAWATLEVVTGGFATGHLLAGGPLTAYERERADGLGFDTDTARASLNGYFLGEDGLAELYARVRDGRYRIELPEEAALPTIAWLLARGEIDGACELIEIIEPYFGQLRFYPAPAAESPREDDRVRLRDVADGLAALEAVRAQPRVLAQKEAVEVWAPYHDRVVALFLQTVVDGWPCRRYPDGWAARARALLDEYPVLRARHPHCGKPDDRGKHYAQLRDFLGRCASEPASLSGREVGRIRLILERYRAKHGEPGEARCQTLRARQAADVGGPLLRDLARIVAARLRACPQDEGLDEIEPVLHRVDADEARAGEVAVDTPIPQPIRRRVERCLSATLEELVARGLIGSGEVVATLLPQASARLRAAAMPDSAARRLYAATYRAFRKRRSLLLLNLQSQVRIEELPWVASLDRFREDGADHRAEARRALSETVALVLSAFPYAILPNKLLTELDALARQAGLDLPLTEEVAADIFMGAFGDKYLRASRRATALLDGSLYARYYDIDAAAVAALPDDKHSLARLCARRAGVPPGRHRPASNGMLLEQQQILTAHNLAVLYADLDLDAVLRDRLSEMASRCLTWILSRQQMKIDGWHARLIMIKQTAYAWRQMVFFVSRLAPAEQREFASAAHAQLAAQSEPLRRRFEPVLRGLDMAVAGERLDDARLRECGALRFLGWTDGSHPLLAKS